MHRILLLANLNPNKFGSMEEHALFVSRELKRRGHLCCLGFIQEPEPAVRRLFEDSGARIVTVPYDERPLWGDPTGKTRQMMALRRMVVKEQIDLIHINFICVTNPLLWGIYLAGVKLVFTDHASGLVLSRSRMKKCVSRLIHSALSRRIARYIGVSRYVHERLRDTHHVCPPQTVTVHNGVNLDRFVPGDRSKARAELDLPLDATVLCAVAMLIPEKGIQHIIEAVALLVREQSVKNLLLVIVGEGEYCGALEQLSRDRNVHDCVQFWGRRSDVHTIVTAADVVVVPPVWAESFGLIIAEAMASGRPVVATKVGGIPELIEDGVSGILVEPGDVHSLAKGILAVLSNQDLRQRLVDAALIKASRQFNLSGQVRKLVDVYEDVLAS